MLAIQNRTAGATDAAAAVSASGLARAKTDVIGWEGRIRGAKDKLQTSPASAIATETFRVQGSGFRAGSCYRGAATAAPQGWMGADDGALAQS